MNKIYLRFLNNTICKIIQWECLVLLYYTLLITIPLFPSLSAFFTLSLVISPWCNNGPEFVVYDISNTHVYQIKIKEVEDTTKNSRVSEFRLPILDGPNFWLESQYSILYAAINHWLFS